MENGEVLFEAPWQGRVFGMAVALHEAGLFTWGEFQACLIEEIGSWDRTADEDTVFQYYEHFQNALNRLLATHDLIAAQDLDARSEQFAARPHGHDHTHTHDH
jgi:nitrile hydratase accessory protein